MNCHLSHHRYLRMSPNRFEHLLSLVEPTISKETTNFCEPISTGERLSLTLHVLASGEMQQSSFAYRIGRATVSKIVKETYDTIYNELAPVLLPQKSG